MASGDITKVILNDKIEVCNAFAIQVRQATILYEENDSGALEELDRKFHRHVLHPFLSIKDPADDSWTHTVTDISSERADVQAIANVVWTDDIKNSYKAMREAQGE